MSLVLSLAMGGDHFPFLRLDSLISRVAILPSILLCSQLLDALSSTAAATIPNPPQAPPG